MTSYYGGQTRLNELTHREPIVVAPGGFNGPWVLPDGTSVSDLALWVQAWVFAGYGWQFRGGEATTPITFAGAYDADGPDFHLHIPAQYAVIPLDIDVTFEAVGTESTMEIIALASPTGDTSVTGSAGVEDNLRIGKVGSSGLTCTVAVDAAGVTDPHVAGAAEFWRYQRPLTDTVATGENDRNPLVFTWNHLNQGPAPLVIGGSAAGSCVAIHAASQAGTGFIGMKALVFPPDVANSLFGAVA